MEWLASGKGDPERREEPASEGPSPHIFSDPKWKNFPGFYEMADAALADDPRLKRWAVDVLADESPMIAGHVDVAAIADLIRVVQRHVPPPAPSRPDEEPTK